jgi:uncharacterized protein YggE
MRLWHLAALGIGIAVLFALPAAAATQDQRTIVVAATGSVSALAAPAQWTLGVKVKDDSARAAMRASSATMTKIVSALEGAGVPATDLTVSTSVAPDEQDLPGSFKGFLATRTVQLTIAGPRRAALLIDKVTRAGGNYVDGPSLADAQNDELVSRAVAAAVDAARVKAGALAEKMGVTLGPIVAVEDGFAYDGLDPLSGEVYATVAVEFAVS